MSKGVISLIYKNSKCELVKNWCPITLLNVDHKIITKTLSEILKLTLPKIINQDEKDYIAGRNINEENRIYQR